MSAPDYTPEFSKILLASQGDVHTSPELTPRERRILCMRFSIGGAADRTLEEIGRDFGVTRERIRQNQSKGLVEAPLSLSGTQARNVFEN